ncbi:hypothetical protein [Cerasicoccus arenae]|uniref:PEP-CTERM protein-sorting domain-containing protein n=1 Tax=Cerasicoccus arenae TaxID=424488 RepID=A0A8J3GFD3_9BACT|nr:hypothetical protein [Cerasicoccus arenae]MBK1857635.1 hypothetical protein [Cerasicoccus arenae]GHC05430.1 hypothetical protein GCM10007047_22910 [Cerasicoccus arenae]
MNKLITIISTLAITTLAHGTLLLNEDFNSLSTGDLNGQNGWTAVSQLDVQSGGLSYSSGDISISGGTNNAVWSGANTQPIGSKGFASQDGDVWFSFTINVSATNNSNRFWFYVSDDADLGNSGVMGQINSGSGALLSGYRATTSQFTSGSNSLPSDETLFLVGKFSKDGISGTGDYDKMEMWINPSSTTLGAGSIAQNVTSTGISDGIDTFAITALGGGSTVLWDNLLVGTTQADVLDVYSIPEPSTITFMIGLSALTIAWTRHRSIV